MLINMRNGMMAGKRLSAKSYVQDGLVAMWDGEWNAGDGVHLDVTDTWVDLVGHHDLLSSDGSQFAFANSACGFARTGPYFSVSDMDLGGLPLTLELAYSFVNDFSSGSYPSAYFTRGVITFAAQKYGTTIKFYGGSSFKEGYYDVRLAGSTKPDVPVADFLKYHYVSVDISTSQYFYARLNGIDTAFPAAKFYNYSGSDASFSVGRDITASINNVRLYAKSLTADEYAANYAVDKARFNLPDAT